MKLLVSLKFLTVLTTLSLFNLYGNPNAEAYMQAFRAVIRFNYLFLKIPSPALHKLINDGITTIEKNATFKDSFFTPNHGEITRTRLWQYTRAEKPKNPGERAAVRTEFIQEIAVLKSFFTFFIDGLNDEEAQNARAALETINQFERDFS